MPTVLHRLYRTKIALISVIVAALGAGLMVAAWAGWAWLPDLTGEFGALGFTTGVVTFAWEYFAGRDAEQRTTESLRAVIREESGALADAVLAGLAADPQRLTALAPATVDTLIRGCLQARTGDAELAGDIYANLHDQFSYAERRYDSRITVTLTPWEHGPAAGLGSMFVATMHWSYHTHALPESLRFSATGDHTEYRRLVHDPNHVVWFFDRTEGMDATDPEVYDLNQFIIDGKPQPIVTRREGNTRTFTVTRTTGPGSGPVHISYTQRVLVSQHGHMLFLDVEPAKGLTVELRYAGCGIRHVSVVDFVTSAHPPRIIRNPDTITIGHDGWTIPRSGAVFVWVLEREVGQAA